MAEDRTVRHPGRIKPHVVPPLSIAEIEDMRQRGLSRLYVDELDALCDQSLSALSHQAALETATRDKDQLQAALQALVDAEDNGANLDRYMDESDQASGWIGGEEYFVPTSCGFATARPGWTEIIHVTRSPFGIGTQEYGIHDDVEPLLHEMKALLTGDRP